jgi:putative membrane protein
MKNAILLFLRGLLMGVCDLIPGISGGTMAFITGIYERLINAVKSFNSKLIKDIFTGKKEELKKDVKKLDLLFLITLIIGIVVALLLGSRVIKFLLENYFAYTLSFFIGLIIASTKIIFNNIKNHKFRNIIFGIIGLVLGVLLSVIIPLEINPSLGYVFLGGFLAVSAMFLPGISGAFILLIIGLYKYMLDVLHNPIEKITILVVFIIGAILGAVVISRIISFLFKKDKDKTLYFLLGLVIGSLSIPVKRIFQTQIATPDILMMIGLFILGIILVIVINRFGRK